MTYNNTPYFRQDTASASAEPFVLAWLYWLRIWLGLSRGMTAAATVTERQRHTPTPVNNRARRRWAMHYQRRGSEAADQQHVLCMMLPPGLSPTQKLERLSHISKMGRVRIYGLRRPHKLRHTRARLLRIFKRICPLRPP